jgi:hypothetical protein
MATHAARVHTIFAKVRETTNELQKMVTQAMSYLAEGQGPKNYTMAAETTEQALMKTVALFEQLRALRSALGKVKPMELGKGAAG